MASSGHDHENLYQLLKRMYNNINELRLHKPLLSNELFIQKLRIGDHLFSERLGGTYSHHGIYIGNNTVIHLQGPHSSAKYSNPCNICHYVPPTNGTVVKTCLDCFHGGHSFRVREYGVQVSGDLIDEWILNKLDASKAIYTCRKGDIFIGKWTERKTVMHLILMKPGSASHYSSCENYSYMTSSSTLETCLKCFLNGGLLYINELELSVARCGGGDDWDSCRDKPIASVFRKLCGKPVDKVYEVWDSISSTRYGIKKMWKQLRAPSFIIYENQQIQICELASTKSPEQIVSSAIQNLEHGFNKYKLLSNNCEHFATACETGSRRSVQAENRKRTRIDKRIQHFLDECEPPSFIRPMETLTPQRIASASSASDPEVFTVLTNCVDKVVTSWTYFFVLKVNLQGGDFDGAMKTINENISPSVNECLAFFIGNNPKVKYLLLMDPSPAPSSPQIDEDDEWDTDGFVIPSLAIEDPNHNGTPPVQAETAKPSSPKTPKIEESIYLGPHGGPPSQQKQIESIPAGRKQKLRHKLKEADKRSSGIGRENKLENLRELVGVSTQNTTSNMPKSSPRDWLDPHCHESETIIQLVNPIGASPVTQADKDDDDGVNGNMDKNDSLGC
ncbi:unnamed protein product [Rhodiola kirilowii]